MNADTNSHAISGLRPNPNRHNWTNDGISGMVGKVVHQLADNPIMKRSARGPKTLLEPVIEVFEGELHLAMSLDHLLDRRSRISLGSSKDRGQLPDKAGVYAWWLSAEGIRDLSLPKKFQGALSFRKPVYIGIAGARRSKKTILTRICQNHLKGPINKSSPRKSIAALLNRRIKRDLQIGKLMKKLYPIGCGNISASQPCRCPVRRRAGWNKV